jgi:hypothetical protein
VICTLWSGGGSWRHPKVPIRWNLPLQHRVPRCRGRLATKLHMPGPRAGQVPRPRLTARLDEGLARGLVLVCAPAGYGKTVLLADWARRGGQPVAWRF